MIFIKHKQHTVNCTNQFTKLNLVIFKPFDFINQFNHLLNDNKLNRIFNLKLEIFFSTDCYFLLDSVDSFEIKLVEIFFFDSQKKKKYIKNIYKNHIFLSCSDLFFFSLKLVI